MSVRGRSLGRDLLGRNVLADETEEWREAARYVLLLRFISIDLVVPVTASRLDISGVFL